MQKETKKMISSILFFILLIQYIFTPLVIYASTTQIAYVTSDGDGVNVRSNTNTSSSILNTLSSYTRLTVYNIIAATDGVCQTSWYYVSYDSTGNKGYVCAKSKDIEYIKLQPKANVSPNYNFDEELLKFPESYRSYIIKLHQENPNWMFKALNTGLDWNQAVSTQSIDGTSFIQGDEGYRLTLGSSYNYATDKWVVKEGSNWYAANSQTVEYYMDPRNFLTEKYIFEFEKLNYDSSYQTIDAVEQILYTDFMKQYTPYLITAAKDYDISPVYLASRIRQEVGLYPSTATSGNEFAYLGQKFSNLDFTYKGIYYNTFVGVKFSNLYNFYNIGATTDTNPVYNGLMLANGFILDGKNILVKTTYNRPWNTPDKAIIGGALYIAEDYINVGQYTPYFQKWNVNPGSYYPVNTHQYMTNIKAPSGEAYSVFKSYVNMGLLGQNFSFVIPIYENMPERTSLPNTGNPNNYLKDITINGNKIVGFEFEKTNYEVYLPAINSTVNIGTQTVNSKAKVTGNGTITLTQKNNPVNITVTAENGAVRNYRINVVRSDIVPISVNDVVNNIGVKNNGNYISGISIGTNVSALVTNVKKLNSLADVVIKDSNGIIKTNDIFKSGDTVTITSGGENKTFTVIVYGDTNGDGQITINDLLRVQKLLLNSMTLSESYKTAADVNKDGNVTILDLLRIQKYLLGSATIDQ